MRVHNYIYQGIFVTTHPIVDSNVVTENGEGIRAVREGSSPWEEPELRDEGSRARMKPVVRSQTSRIVKVLALDRRNHRGAVPDGHVHLRLVRMAAPVPGAWCRRARGRSIGGPAACPSPEAKPISTASRECEARCDHVRSKRRCACRRRRAPPQREALQSPEGRDAEMDDLHRRGRTSRGACR